MSLHPDFAAELRKHFAGDIRLDLASRILYSTDASIYQIEPVGVVIPRTREDVQAVVEFAARRRVPIVPRGAGTSLAGQAIGEGLIVDCSRWLNSILDIDPDECTARVEPGVVLSDLNHAAGRFGLQFGPDPASAERATMGGVVANNATGAHSILYGMAADHLMSANVILADGSAATLGAVPPDEGAPDSIGSDRRAASESRFAAILAAAREIRTQHKSAIVKRFPRSWRNSAGYRINYLLPWAPSAPPGWPQPNYPARELNTEFNLAHLLAGSEGTLAIIQDVTVRLVPKPNHTVLGILSYEDVSVACEAVPKLLELRPSAIELIPRLILESARRIPGYASQMGWLNGDPGALLVVEFSGDDLSALTGRARELGPLVQLAAAPEQQAMVWATRKAGLGLLDSLPRSARPTAFIEDCAIPVEHLGAFVAEIRKIMEAHGASGGIYGHASAGCLHIRPVLDLKTGSGVGALREIAEQTLQLTLRLGGAMSSEHGDGIARGEWLRETYGDQIAQAMLDLKKAADPAGILNPGKMLEAPPMDSRLRYGTAYRSQPWSPPIDFAARGGLAMAVEQCNGQGLCRKETGVMCPSYQATREEEYSTRGRANLLRALISTGGTLPGHRKTRGKLDEAVQQALDLCLGCKGCLAECPSGVDMARLKAAYLEYRYRRRLRPMRDYLFGYFGVTARALSLMDPLLREIQRVPPFWRLGARLFGVAPQRTLPAFAPYMAGGQLGAGSPTTLLLRDPFSHYIDGQVEAAALHLLGAAGFHVRVLQTVSAGAALISKGFLKSARRHARRLLDELTRVDRRGDLPLVVLEPSELSAVRHDYPDLMLDQPEGARARLAQAMSVEQLLVESGKLEALPRRVVDTPVLFHPHCHERAGSRASGPVGTESYFGMQLLRLCGYSVELIDAGCCGMGGTFGFEAEHYEISQKIGELRLFPALAAAEEALVAATGGACRLQITQGTGRQAQHPLVLASRALRLE